MPAPVSTAHVAPPAAALAAIVGPSTDVVRLCQIVDAAGNEYALVESSGITDGSVSVDQTRAERRAFELTLENVDGRYKHAQGQLWYDKIVKLWRGVNYVESGVAKQWVTQIGEFMIDSITSQNFPHTIKLQGRDYTKKLLTSQFKVPTSFAQGINIEDLIKTIALNGGITKFILPNTGQQTAKNWFFDSGVTRWDAMTQIATNYGYELYFDGMGYLVMRKFQDPISSATTMTFSTGAFGNLASYSKSSKDARLYNSIVVIGEGTNTTPIYATAQNTTPGSPTSIANIGERVYTYKSAFITTQAQAQQVANNFLAVNALEEYELGLTSIVLPWLEAGDIVEFVDPAPQVGEPTRFLLSNFSIPMKLGGMSSACKRVTKVL